MTEDLSPSGEQGKSYNLPESECAAVAATKESCSKNTSVQLMNRNSDY